MQLFPDDGHILKWCLKSVHFTPNRNGIYNEYAMLSIDSINSIRAIGIELIYG